MAKMEMGQSWLTFGRIKPEHSRDTAESAGYLERGGGGGTLLCLHLEPSSISSFFIFLISFENICYLFYLESVL